MGRRAKHSANKSKSTDDDDALLEQAVAAANAERQKAQIDASPYKAVHEAKEKNGVRLSCSLNHVTSAHSHCT